MIQSIKRMNDWFDYPNFLHIDSLYSEIVGKKLVGMYCTKLPMLWRVIIVGGEILFPNSGQISLFSAKIFCPFTAFQYYRFESFKHRSARTAKNFCVHIFSLNLWEKIHSCTMNRNFVVARCPFLPHIAA